MTVTVTANAPSLRRVMASIKDLREDQIPFALSLAMNRSAIETKKALPSYLRRKFRMRSDADRIASLLRPNPSKQGKSGSVAQGWSNKSQWPDLRVRFSTTAFMYALQEVGGTKPAKAPQAWIPTRYVRYDGAKKVREHTPSVIRKALAGNAAAAQRTAATGKRRRSRARVRYWESKGTIYERVVASKEVRPLYLLRKRAQVPARLEIEGFIKGVFTRRLGPLFQQAMSDAMSTAKKRR